jgi:predicted RNase H-like HicB family nuclease
MKYVYPVLFENEDGKVLVSVPDLRGCFTFGNDLIDAMEMAVDAMSMWLATAEDQGETLPLPTNPHDVSVGAGFVSMVLADTDAWRNTCAAIHDAAHANVPAAPRGPYQTKHEVSAAPL